MTTAPSSNGVPHTPRDYFALGLLPVPVPHRTKECLLKGWPSFRRETIDLDSLFPDDGKQRGVGIVLGPSGIADVDLDCHEAVTVAPMLLPPCGWVFGRKSNPMSHYEYRCTGQPVHHKEYVLADGTKLMELRAGPHMTVYPGSVHEDDEPITWERFEAPGECASADLECAVGRVAAAALLAQRWPRKGSRHDARLDLAGGLLRAGFTEEDAEKIIRAVCIASHCAGLADCGGVVRSTASKLKDGDKNVRGWPALAGIVGDEVVTLARKWLGIERIEFTRGSAPPKKPPRRIEPYCPFPTESLPEPIRSLAVQGAAAIGCDPSYIALPALSVAAALVGNSRTIRLKPNWTEPAIVWSAIIGDSGTLKSPGLTIAVAPLYRLQRQLVKRFKADLKEYETAKEAYAYRKQKAKKDDKDFTEEPPEEPTLARLVTGDITIEKLAQFLEDNCKGLLVCRDELGAWLSSFRRYKGAGGGTDLPNWLELHRAGVMQVDRKTGDRPTLFISHAAACVAGGIQPSTLARSLTPEYMEAGLGARLLMAMPPKQPKQWTETEIDPVVTDDYSALLHRLHELQMTRDNDDERSPFAVRMTPEAKALWVSFYNEWAAVQRHADGELAAAYSKLEGYAARLGLIHHVVSRVGDLEDSQPIEPVSIQAGITLTRWFANEIGRIYVTLGESEEERLTRRLVEFIRSHGGKMTASALHKSNKSRYPSTEAAEAALDELLRAGIGESIESNNPKGGRPTRTFTLKVDTPKPQNPETPYDGDEEDDSGDNPPTPQPTPKPTSPEEFPEKSDGFGAFGIWGKDTKQSATAGGEQNTEVSGSDGGLGVSGSENGLSGEVNSGSPATFQDNTTSHTPYPKSPETVAYRLVTDAADLPAVAAAVEESSIIGLDTETTGLDPRTDRIRLLSLDCDTDGGRFTYVVDCFAVDPAPLFEALAAKPLIIHHAAFDLAMLRAIGFVPTGPVHCTMLLAQLLTAGTFAKCGLEAVVQRELNKTLDKTHQKSAWTGPLTPAQLQYAAEDAAVLFPLWRSLSTMIKAADLEQAAEIERRCLPAVVWTATSGVPFDRQRWEALAATAHAEAERLASELDAASPRRPNSFVFNPWNWDSPQQMQEMFALAGVNIEKTDDDTLAAIDHPLAVLLRQYRDAQKRSTTYGRDWMKHVADDCRVYAGWKQYGAKTGRMASGEPNMQNVPRDPAYRQCFHPGSGRVLVKADYSQIELRIAAKVANEARMIEAYHRGDDLHTLTAQRMTGKTEITKQERQLAKPVNFGLIYGLGAKALARKAKAEYGLDLSLEDAERYRSAFFASYPGIVKWHNQIKRQQGTETRTLTGRRVIVDADYWYGGRANYIVQGTGGDGIKLALALLWERRGEMPGAFPVLIVHDEIVVECGRDQAEAVAAWLRQAMLDGMTPLIDPVPVEVEVKVAETWGG